METVTAGRWNDDRMDDLKHQVDDLGRRMDQGFIAANRRMDDGFAAANHRMDQGFAAANRRMDQGFAEVNQRFDALQRTMIQFGAVMIAALVGLLATQLGLILTQL